MFFKAYALSAHTQDAGSRCLVCLGFVQMSPPAMAGEWVTLLC